MGDVNGNGMATANGAPSAHEVLLGLYQQESYLRKQVNAFEAQIRLIEQQKAEVYARLQGASSEGTEDNADLKQNIRAGLDSIAALAGIDQEA